jgi:hypothetical protein
MLYGQDIFYFATIRKITACFGALFTNIVVNRYDQPGGVGTVLQSIKVPMSYGPANSWIRVYNETRRRGDTLRLKTFFPRISFENIGMEYSRDRKLVTMNGVFTPNSGSNTLATFVRQLNPVPYDFYYDVHVTTKSIDDGLQIIEQILPNFTPSFNLTITDIPELGITRDAPVIFLGVDSEDDYEKTLSEERTIKWTLHFKVQGYLYPIIRDADIIKEVIANIYNDEEMTDDSKRAIVTVSVDPIDADPDDNYDIITTIEEL